MRIQCYRHSTTAITVAFNPHQLHGERIISAHNCISPAVPFRPSARFTSSKSKGSSNFAITRPIDPLTKFVSSSIQSNSIRDLLLAI